MRVTILHNSVPPDASPDEADVLVQAEAVGRALRGRGHATTTFGCDLDLRVMAGALAAGAPEAVFNLVEGLAGHGRLIHLPPFVLEALGIPHAGCPAEAIYATGHKTLAKSLLRAAGLPTPDWLEPDGDPAAGAPPPDRWIVKAVWEDASLGMDDAAVVASDEAARLALAARAGRPGGPWFAEAFVEGREFNLSLLDGPEGPQVLPAAEMLFHDFPPGKPRIVGYAAKWHAGSFEYEHTARTFDLPPADGPLLAELNRLALACWRLFRLRGWARVDFRVDRAGRPWILEINANPCLAPDAGFAAAVARAGLTYADAVDRILAAAG